MTDEKLRIAIPAEVQDIKNYLAALRALGAEPVQVTIDCDAAAFDGLLLPGGVDVNPVRYGKENVGCAAISDELDEWQLTVMDRFVKLGKPVLGICRGHQVVNVYFGGTLIQHISSAARHARELGVSVDRAHLTHAEAGSFLAELYGTDFTVNSAHHQATDTVGEGLHAVQYSDDGVVEGAYHESLPVWSVQWHPERMCFARHRSDTVDGSLLLRFFLNKVNEHLRAKQRSRARQADGLITDNA